jgi:hypothetical protein
VKLLTIVADPDPLDTDPDPAFYFGTDPDPTGTKGLPVNFVVLIRVTYGSES